MEFQYQFQTAPAPCPYLAGRISRLLCYHVLTMTLEEYDHWLRAGWRRFGRDMFQPDCFGCIECQSLRVDTRAFLPNRSQRRNARLNQGFVRLQISEPEVDEATVELHRRFHANRELARGWPRQFIDAESITEAFVDNPFPTEQWRYYLDGQLVGIGYVDATPSGLSAIYFVHEPALARRGLGTWNVLQLIDEARRRELPHVYLGYWVRDCQSLSYKANFFPHEIRSANSRWLPILDD